MTVRCLQRPGGGSPFLRNLREGAISCVLARVRATPNTTNARADRGQYWSRGGLLGSSSRPVMLAGYEHVMPYESGTAVHSTSRSATNGLSHSSASGGKWRWIPG